MSDTTLGIVIGSGMTLAGVVLQGIISWFLGWRKDVRDEERQKRARREAAYPRSQLWLLRLFTTLRMRTSIASQCP